MTAVSWSCPVCKDTGHTTRTEKACRGHSTGEGRGGVYLRVRGTFQGHVLKSRALSGEMERHVCAVAADHRMVSGCPGENRWAYSNT